MTTGKLPFDVRWKTLVCTDCQNLIYYYTTPGGDKIPVTLSNRQPHQGCPSVWPKKPKRKHKRTR